MRFFSCRVHFDTFSKIPAKYCFWAHNSYESILIVISGSTETLLASIGVIWRGGKGRTKKPLLTILWSCKLSISGIKTSLSLLPHQQEVRPCSDRLQPILGRRNQFVNGENWLLFATAVYSTNEGLVIAPRHKVFIKPHWNVSKTLLPFGWRHSLRHATLYCDVFEN